MSNDFRHKLNKMKLKLLEANYAIRLLEAQEISKKTPIIFSNESNNPNAVRFATQLFNKLGLENDGTIDTI